MFARLEKYSYLCSANGRRWAHISNNSHGHTNLLIALQKNSH